MDTIAKILIALVAILAISILLTIPVYYIWNDIIPSLFSLRKINFSEALELSVLCSCLFKSSNTSNSK